MDGVVRRLNYAGDGARRRSRNLHPAGFDDPVEELPRPGLLGVGEDPGRRPLLEDPARVEEADAVGDVAGERHLVGRDHHRHARGRELPDHVEHLGDQLGVEGGRDLVEQQDVGRHGEGPHDRDPLLLAARERVRVVDGLLGEAEPRQELGRRTLRLGPWHPEDLARRERHVVDDPHVGKQVVGLVHDPDPAPDAIDLHALGGDLVALDPDPAGIDRLDQVDAAQERRLATPRRPDKRDDLMLGHVEVDATQDLQLPERLVEPLDR